MEKCRHCGSERIVIKTGHRDGQQKWRCKDCGKFQGEKDRREKYSEKERKMAITLYLEGCGFRRIASILSEMFEKHFCYQTVILWIKKEAKKIESSNVDAKNEIQILEMDELYTYIKKSNKIRVWTAVDRNAFRFATFEVGDASGESLKKILNKLSYCFINTIYSDGNFAYDKFIPKSIQHFVTKSETCLVESYNSVLRYYLARL